MSARISAHKAMTTDRSTCCVTLSDSAVAFSMCALFDGVGRAVYPPSGATSASPANAGRDAVAGAEARG